MNPNESKFRDHARRRLVLRLAACGALGIGGLAGFVGRALAKGDVPPGVNRVDGRLTVNGREARAGTPVGPGDRVSTGPASRAVIVVRDDAFLLREETSLEFAPSRGALSRVLVDSGRVLSVFGPKPLEIRVGKALIGIRGTGVYLEKMPDSVYFCLCYGEADLDGPGMAVPKRIVTRHHEQPLMISEAGGVMRAEPGPFKNHSDDELTLLESLVGRVPPFEGTYPQKRY